jgi:FHS family Na+ dependent glucose MFS transporter 1
VVWVHGDRVDPYMNALHFFFGVGAFISPIIIAQAVLLSGGIRSAYWVLAVLMLPVAIVMLRQPSPSAASQLGGSSAANAAPTDAARATDGRVGEARGTRQDVTLVLLIALFFFLYVGAESSLGGWIATYAKTIGLGSSDPQEASATAAYLTAAFWGAVTLGRLFSIPLAAHFSPRRVLSADLIGCVASAAVLLAWPGNPVATWVGTLGAGLSMASIFPTSLSLAERHLPITGTITSVFFVGASLGGVSVPWLIGQFFERVGPRVTIAAISVAVVLSALVFAVILVHTKKAERSFRHV